jgi:hypothetical protein
MSIPHPDPGRHATGMVHPLQPIVGGTMSSRVIFVAALATLATGACEPRPDPTPTPMAAPIGTADPPVVQPVQPAGGDLDLIRGHIDELARLTESLRAHAAALRTGAPAGAAPARGAALADSLGGVFDRMLAGRAADDGVALRLFGTSADEHTRILLDLEAVRVEAATLGGAPAAAAPEVDPEAHRQRMEQLAARLDRVVAHMRAAVAGDG